MSGRTRDRLGSAGLTAGAVLGSLCLLLVVVAPLVGMRALLFRSGSMAPTVATGDIALSRTTPATEIRVGDVVSVRTGSGQRVTHRVVSIAPVPASPDRRTLTLKGDANATADPTPYPVSSVDRVLLVVPYLGRLVAFLGSPLGLVLVGAALLGALLPARRPSGPPARGGRRRVERGPSRGRGPAALHRSVVLSASFLAMVVAAGVASPAQAVPWTDAVPITVQLTTPAIATPVVSCGTLVVGTTTLNWTVAPGATGYTLGYGAGSATTEDVGPNVTSKTFTGVVASGTFRVRARYGTSWTSGWSNSKNYTVAIVVVGICTDA